MVIYLKNTTPKGDLLFQDNVLLDAKFHVKIADFGLTRYSESTVTHSGSLHYNFAAPELFGIPAEGNSASDDYVESTARTQKSDVYAFGCLYYEVSVIIVLALLTYEECRSNSTLYRLRMRRIFRL